MFVHQQSHLGPRLSANACLCINRPRDQRRKVRSKIAMSNQFPIASFVTSADGIPRKARETCLSLLSPPKRARMLRIARRGVMSASSKHLLRVAPTNPRQMFSEIIRRRICFLAARLTVSLATFYRPIYSSKRENWRRGRKVFIAETINPSSSSSHVAVLG